MRNELGVTFVMVKIVEEGVMGSVVLRKCKHSGQFNIVNIIFILLQASANNHVSMPV